MAEFRMPSLGTDMDSGTLVEWLKKPGEPVRRGDVVAVVETQKGAIEVEVFLNGVMGQPLVPLGAKVPVGTPLAVIEETGANSAAAAPATQPVAAPPPSAPAVPMPPPFMAATRIDLAPPGEKG